MMLTETAKSISEIYRNGMMKIAAIYIEAYKKNTEKEIEFIKRSECAKEILKTVYNYMVRDGLTPIEDLSREEKLELIKDGGKDINLCKSLYVLKTI